MPATLLGQTYEGEWAGFGVGGRTSALVFYSTLEVGQLRTCGCILECAQSDRGRQERTAEGLVQVLAVFTRKRTAERAVCKGHLRDAAMTRPPARTPVARAVASHVRCPLIMTRQARVGRLHSWAIT